MEDKLKFVEYLRIVSLWASMLAVLTVIYEYGFANEADAIPYRQVYLVVIGMGLLAIAGRYLFPSTRPAGVAMIFDIAIALYIAAVILGIAGLELVALFSHPAFLYVAVFIMFIRELSIAKPAHRLRYLTPSQLFAGSYLVFIMAGTVLLMLPNATYSGISLINAFFTATSAFCVTGLAVVDTGTYFTTFGQVVIIVLVQLGGIGIMTFTSFFRHLFTGQFTYGDQILLKDMTSSDRITEVFGTIRIIILFTLLIEAAGALLIYFTIDNQLFGSVEDRVYFAIFHSVSGFCNAGFSTLTEGLYNDLFRFNYSLHLVIAMLFISGGLGFPILLNFARYMKHLLINRVLNRRPVHAPRVVNINTRIVFIGTLVLLLTGTALFLIFEADNTLAEHQGAGKAITAFFGAATPRTAGFNTVDTSALTMPVLMVMMLFMWIGAGPGSTGGGVKITSFTLAVMNVISIARGKDRIEVFGREISNASVKRAFAFILLFFLVTGMSIFLIAIIERDIDLLPLAFECFSAYGTVGLSMGITADLSAAGKFILAVNMFTGRIGMLMVLFAIVKKVKHLNYRYPEEGILIN